MYTHSYSQHAEFKYKTILSRPSSHLTDHLCHSSSDVLAVLWQNDLLTNLELRWVNVVVESLNLTDSGVVGSGQIDEKVTGHNVVSTDSLALGRWADWDGDDLANIDGIWVLDLSVGSDEGVERDVD